MTTGLDGGAAAGRGRVAGAVGRGRVAGGAALVPPVGPNDVPDETRLGGARGAGAARGAAAMLFSTGGGSASDLVCKETSLMTRKASFVAWYTCHAQAATEPEITDADPQVRTLTACHRYATPTEPKPEYVHSYFRRFMSIQVHIQERISTRVRKMGCISLGIFV